MIKLLRFKNFSENASCSGSGDASNPIVDGSNGSGDIPRYLRKKSRKKGNPSEVSDLRDLEVAKIDRISE